MIGHYTTKVVEDWTRVMRDRRTAMEQSAKDSFMWVASALTRSVHYSISKAAFPLVAHTDVHQDVLSGTRLPFPEMVIEYDFDFSVVHKTTMGVKYENGRMETPAPKRIIMLTDVPEANRFTLTSVYYQPELRQLGELPISWILCPLAVAIPYAAFDCVGDWYVRSPTGERGFMFNNPDKLDVSPILIPSAPCYASAITDVNREAVTDAARDLTDEIRTALSFLSILSCGNAPILEVDPPPKLNKKRQKSGKPPLHRYRTLHISDHTTRGHRGPTGSHASPVAHWRRGHIRNQPTAKGYIRKWIQPTIVGVGTPQKPDIVLT